MSFISPLKRTPILELPEELRVDISTFLNNSGKADALQVTTCKAWKQTLPKKHLDLSTSAITDADLIRIIQENKQLTSINLSYCRKITDVGIAFLSQLPYLRSINLEGCVKITDVGINNFILPPRRQRTWNEFLFLKKIDHEMVPLKNLQQLSVKGCHHITNAALESISYLENLRELNIEACSNLSDEGLACISTLRFLEILRIKPSDLSGRMSITNRGCGYLSRLHSLKHLWLEDCFRVSREGVEQLSYLPIASLSLAGCTRIGDRAVRNLLPMENLTYLSLSRCTKITAEGLEALHHMPHLKQLNIDGCWRAIPQVVQD